MPYQIPFVDESGLTIPSYQEILDDLIAQAKIIYGQDIYLGEDSADYQFISIFALKISDCMKSIQLSYSNRSPQTAIGAALDSIIKLNGIRRKVATYSTCTVELTGTAGTVILNGIVGDINGNKWNLPASVTIGIGGTVSATATCQELGAITALPGNISTILTPTSGWLTVNNSTAAVAGQPVETDTALRIRQAISTSLPSSTMLAGTISAIAAIDAVTRYKVYENPTNINDAYGHPPHSITAIAEGGTDDEVANAIFYNRGIGCYTNGDVIVPVTDPETDVITDIRFYRPTAVPIFVTIDIKELLGFNTETVTLLKFAVAAYINSLQIGDGLPLSSIYAAALSSMPSLLKPSFSVQTVVQGKLVGSQTAADITVLFNEVVQGDVNNITVNIIP